MQSQPTISERSGGLLEHYSRGCAAHDALSFRYQHATLAILGEILEVLRGGTTTTTTVTTTPAETEPEVDPTAGPGNS